MLSKTYKEINNFTSDIETLESHDKLLAYINSSFYASIKLLISVSSTFSIYWKVVLPFIVSFGGLLLLYSIKPLGDELDNILNINYVLGVFICLVLFTLVYILRCKKYFILCIEKSKSLMKQNT